MDYSIHSMHVYFESSLFFLHYCHAASCLCIIQKNDHFICLGGRSAYEEPFKIQQNTIYLYSNNYFRSYTCWNIGYCKRLSNRLYRMHMLQFIWSNEPSILQFFKQNSIDHSIWYVIYYIRYALFQRFAQFALLWVSHDLRTLTWRYLQLLPKCIS